MPTGFQIINPLTDAWNDMLISANDSSFFHTTNWANVLMKSYSYTPKYFARIANDQIADLLPIMEVKSIITGKRGISLPFSDYCELVCSEKNGYKEILEFLKDYGNKAGWKYLELRAGEKIFPDVTPSMRFYGHRLKLSEDYEDNFKQLRGSTQRNIRKSLREGVKVRIDATKTAVEEFYRLNCITRRQHGLPPQPRRFFHHIYDCIISQGKGIVVLAAHEGNSVAASMYFHHGSKLLYKYGASDTIYQNLRANNLVMWEAIKWGCQNGFKEFCFGRTEQHNLGLVQFKMGWGAEQNTIYYYKYDLRKGCFVSELPRQEESLSHKAFRKMPVPVLKAIGNILYRHMA